MDWYYVKAGQRVGPVDVPGLKELIAKGELTQSDLVWNQTLGREWAKISAMAELQETPAESAPVKSEAPSKPAEPAPKTEPVSAASTPAKSEPEREDPTGSSEPKKSIFGAAAASAAKKAEAKSSGIGPAGGKGPGLKKKEAAHAAAEPKQEPKVEPKPEPKIEPTPAVEKAEQPAPVQTAAPVAATLVRPVSEPEPVHVAPSSAAPKLHVKRPESESVKLPEPAEARPKSPSLISAALAQQKQVVEPMPTAGAPSSSEGISSIRSSLAALNKNVTQPTVQPVVIEPVQEMPSLMAPAKDVAPPMQNIVLPDESMTLTADEIVRQGREAGLSEKDLMAALLAQGASKKDAKEALKKHAPAPVRLPVQEVSPEQRASKIFGITVAALVLVLVASLGVLGYMVWQRM